MTHKLVRQAILDSLADHGPLHGQEFVEAVKSRLAGRALDLSLGRLKDVCWELVADRKIVWLRDGSVGLSS